MTHGFSSGECFVDNELRAWFVFKVTIRGLSVGKHADATDSVKINEDYTCKAVRVKMD